MDFIFLTYSNMENQINQMAVILAVAEFPVKKLLKDYLLAKGIIYTMPSDVRGAFNLDDIPTEREIMHCDEYALIFDISDQNLDTSKFKDGDENEKMRGSIQYFYRSALAYYGCLQGKHEFLRPISLVLDPVGMVLYFASQSDPTPFKGIVMAIKKKDELTVLK